MRRWDEEEVWWRGGVMRSLDQLSWHWIWWQGVGWGRGGRQHENLTSQLTAGGRRTTIKFDYSTMIGCWRLWCNVIGSKRTPMMSWVMQLRRECLYAQCSCLTAERSHWAVVSRLQSAESSLLFLSGPWASEGSRSHSLWFHDLQLSLRQLQEPCSDGERLLSGILLHAPFYTLCKHTEVTFGLLCHHLIWLTPFLI